MTKPWQLRRDDLMTREEWERLRHYLRERAELAERRRTRTPIRNEAVVVTAVAPGMRRAEIASLNVGDVRLSNQDPFVIVRRGKGDKYREIPISAKFRAFLKRYLRFKASWGESLRDDAPLFMGERGRYTGSGIYRLFRKCCVAAGIRPLRVHAARHFLGARLYELTKDLVLVRKVLGHSRIVTTQVYVELDDSQIREGLAMYDSILSGSLGNGPHRCSSRRGRAPVGRPDRRKAAAQRPSMTQSVPVAI